MFYGLGAGAGADAPLSQAVTSWGLVLDPELDVGAGCVTGEETRDQSLVSLQIQDHIIHPTIALLPFALHWCHEARL